MGWMVVLVHTTLALLSCGVLSFFLFINMYITTDVTITETVIDTNKVPTHVIAIVAPLDEVLKSE